MKILAIILMLLLSVFLMYPVSACSRPSAEQKDCCAKKRNKENDKKKHSCESFVNCCCRACEVVKRVHLAQTAFVSEKPFYNSYEADELQGVTHDCWHPPRIGLSHPFIA